MHFHNQSVTKLFLILSVSIWLSACGGGGGDNGSDATSSNTNFTTAARTTLLTGGDADCPTGGILVQTGIDENGDGVLNDSEVDSVNKVCNGLAGVQGQQGAAGPKGATGTQGPQGAAGLQGTQGIQGPLGPQGTPGTDANETRVSALENQIDVINTRLAALENRPKALVEFGPPTITNDNNGYPLGSIYIDSGTDDVYLSIDDTISAAVWKSITEKPYSIGDQGPGGGIVFYVTQGGIHGLEVGPLFMESAPKQWGTDNGGAECFGAESNSVGMGRANTEEILNFSGCAAAGTAFRWAQIQGLGGNFDWHLPSQVEMLLVRRNVGDGNAFGLGNVAQLNQSFYWTSTEIGLDQAIYLNNTDGTTAVSGKTATLYVRPIRAF